MDDVRKAAEERASRPRTAEVGASFESERQRSKNALVKQLDALDGRNVRKIAAAALGLVLSVVGYTLGRAYVYSTPAYAVAKFPFQILQTLVGSTLALLLCWKCGVVKIFQRRFGQA